MLQKSSDLVADCYRRAGECSEKANAIDREFFGEMERRWLFLANSTRSPNDLS
jgi:hypothetical protein